MGERRSLHLFNETEYRAWCNSDITFIAHYSSSLIPLITPPPPSPSPSQDLIRLVDSFIASLSSPSARTPLTSSSHKTPPGLNPLPLIPSPACMARLSAPASPLYSHTRPQSQTRQGDPSCMGRCGDVLSASVGASAGAAQAGGRADTRRASARLCVRGCVRSNGRERAIG